MALFRYRLLMLDLRNFSKSGSIRTPSISAWNDWLGNIFFFLVRPCVCFLSQFYPTLRVNSELDVIMHLCNANKRVFSICSCFLWTDNSEGVSVLLDMKYAVTSCPISNWDKVYAASLFGLSLCCLFLCSSNQCFVFQSMNLSSFS